MQDYRANHRIRAREVFLVDASGQKLGVVSLNDAMAAARQAGLDLVEVSGNTNPPVCKILDFGKFRYELAKRDREAKRHNLAAKVKEMKFHVNIDPHDYATKMRHAEDFLWKGMKVKVVMAFRGREMQHQDLGKTLVNSIRSDLKLVGVADAEPKLIGKNITMMLTPLPVKKRVRRWTTEEAEGADEEESGEEGPSDCPPEDEKICRQALQGDW
ncbi:MAG: translation initiation factor IF-3 [Verrucomicrobia bacterium]|nr:translation initiation factor IF-3 [Verrucomicrobiota bacterium]